MAADVCSLRALFAVSTAGAVAYARRYVAVERRARRDGGEACAPMPADADFVALLLRECRPDGDYDTLLQLGRPNHPPVYGLGADGSLWPVLVVQRRGYFYVAIPYVGAQCASPRPSLVELPAVTMALAILHDVASLATGLLSSGNTTAAFDELHDCLSLAMPLGSPIDTTGSTLRAVLQAKAIPNASSEKQAVAKPLVHKGKSTISLSVTEHIRAVQYDKPDVVDVWDVFGAIKCKAEIVGNPDVTLTIATTVGIDRLSTHPCVQSGDLGLALPGARKLCFNPPNGQFDLCHYRVSGIKELPLRAFYQMKETSPTSIKFLLQLKMYEKVQNSFESCEVRIPFFNRGQVASFDASPTTGAVSLAPNRRWLLWNIGQRFAGRNLEAALPATVQFSHSSAAGGDDTAEDDPFCVGLNAYVQLSFKIPDYTMSGCAIDPRTVGLYPSAKIKATCTREFVSAEYVVWNTFGAAKTTVMPQSAFDEVA